MANSVCEVLLTEAGLEAPARDVNPTSGAVVDFWGVVRGLEDGRQIEGIEYEAHRAMMEAYGLRKYHSATGVVQWMGSNPWPGLIWHTYDYYLYPAGTYFGMKKALEPLHIMYSYPNNAVFITNSLQQAFAGLTAEATVYNVDGSVKFTKRVASDVEPDGVKACFSLPAVEGLSDTYFLRLQLSDARGAVKSINWYWLSKKGDILNWSKSTWYMTPESGYADYSALQTIGKTTLAVAAVSAKRADSSVHTITITNTGKTVAFQVHLRALKGRAGDDILPVIFSDNYLELAPGETRVVTCVYADRDAEGGVPFFLASGWNLEAEGSKTTANAGFDTQK